MIALSEVIPEAAVLVDPDAADKWALIGLLCRCLADSGQASTGLADRIHAAVVAREESMSTGMEMGVALPHASVPSLDRLAVALAVMPAGMDFPAMDGQPTQIVILLAIPHNDRILHVRTMAHASRLLHDKGTRQAVLGAAQADQVLAALREAEGRFQQVN